MIIPDGYIGLPKGTLLEDGDLFVTGQAYLAHYQLPGGGITTRLGKDDGAFRRDKSKMVVPAILISELTKKISHYKQLAKSNHAQIAAAVNQKDKHGSHSPNSERIKRIKQLLTDQEGALK